MTQILPTTAEHCNGKLFRYIITLRATEKATYKVVCVYIKTFIAELVRRGHPIGPKDGSGIVAAILTTGSRLEGKNVLFVTAIILDIDGKFKKDGVESYEYIDLDEFLAQVAFLGVAHTSYNHSRDVPKFRVILPLDRPVTKEEGLRLWWWIFERCGRKCDPACKNPDRMFYLPRANDKAAQAAHWIRELHGPLLSIDMVPPDFEPPVERAVPSKTESHERMRLAPVPHEEACAVLRACLKHPLIDWMLDEPAAVDREVWRGTATNLAAAASGHEDLIEVARKAFHEISEIDERYTWHVCEKTFWDAVKSAESPGPMIFETMRLHGAPDEVCTGGRGLVAAARAKVRRGSWLR